MINEEDLSKRLLNLPIDLQEKVLLWLTYKGLKPVSEINAIKRELADGDLNAIKDCKNEVRKWIEDAGLEYSFDSKYPDSWHVGRDKSEIDLSLSTLRIFDFENQYKTGILLGYPESSAKAYAKNRVLKLTDRPVPIIWPGNFLYHQETKNKYFTPYIFYALSIENLENDLNVAKKWADVIRSDIPELANIYEKNYFGRADNEDRDRLERIRRDGQTVEEVMQEFSSLNKKDLFIKLVDDFFNDRIDDFKLSAIVHILKKDMSIPKSDALDNAEKVYLQPGEDKKVSNQALEWLHQWWLNHRLD